MDRDRDAMSMWQKLKHEVTPDRKMLPVKLIIFLYVSGVAAFLPYLTLHMSEIGLTMEEIAIIYAVIPIISLFGPSISGMIADKLRNYKLVLGANILLCALFHSALLAFPPIVVNREVIFDRSNFSFHCQELGKDLKLESCPNQVFATNETLRVIAVQNCFVDCKENDVCFPSGTNASTCFGTGTLDHEIIYNATNSWTTDCSYYLNELLESGRNCTRSSCSLTCQTTFQSYEHTIHPERGPYIFYVYFFFRIMATIALNSSFTMLDSVVLAKIKQEKKGDFGKQRIMTVLGQAFAPLLVGVIVDYLNEGHDYINYSFAFYLSDGLLVFAVIILSQLDLKVEVSSSNMMKELKQLMSRLEINVFLILLVILGSNWGFLETFLFIYLKELGAPTYMLGITLTVGMLSGLPLLYIADRINEKFGRHNVFIISFVAYFVRFFGYSMVSNPWMCLPFEILEVFTYQLMWVAAATYCPILAPKGLIATMTGIAGAFHYSLGRGVGSFLGGYLMLWCGSRKTFQIFGYFSIGGLIIHLFSHYFYLNKITKRRELLLKEEKEKELKLMNEETKQMI